ncbi:antitoxin [Quadrisphaera setariae]|uniref:Antitoxin n=1 Tax=Quadrisphaera setariae TaxID=2593304 RepID=A0A5C8ZJL2_9ACTN|nr:antitoxin [Quadrisphaera setariae]TXR57368.1 antitoxin [Quadrisphaera setariae]
MVDFKGLADKAKDLAGKHPDQADQVVERGGDAVDARTGGKYADKVDVGQEKANAFLDGQGDARGGEPRQ